MTPRIGSLVWGYNQPGYVLIAALLPTGRVYLTDEWKFSHKTIPEVATEFSERFGNLRVTMHGDESLDLAPDDETLTTESTRQVFARHRIPITLVNVGDEHGWQRIHDWFRDAPDGSPWLVASPRCDYVRRTIPALVADPNHPDEIDNGQEDRAALALRVLLASRPAPGTVQKPDGPPAYMTLGWVKSLDQKQAPALGCLARR